MAHSSGLLRIEPFAPSAHWRLATHIVTKEIIGEAGKVETLNVPWNRTEVSAFLSPPVLAEQCIIVTGQRLTQARLKGCRVAV